MTVALVYLGRRGGGAAYSLLVAKALASRCDLSSIVSVHAENLQDWLASGLRVVAVPTYRTATEFITSTLDLRNLLRVSRAIADLRPSIVYYPMLHLWTPFINVLLGDIPKVLTIHDPTPHLGERYPGLQWIQRWALGQATRVIALSQDTASILERQGVDASLIDIIPHGEFSLYRNISPDGGLTASSPQGLRMLFFGRILPYKGISVLLQAYEQVKARLPGVRLTLAGSGDLTPYYGKLRSFANDVEVVNRWIPDSEVGSFFAGADLVVLPYLEASQSGVIPIAYAYGIPVVATAVGGLSEQVVHGVTGYLVPPGDPEALANACIELLQDPARRRSMGLAGYRKAMTEWSWESIADRVYGTLKTAAGRRRP